MDMRKKSDDFVVCLCEKKTKGEVTAAIRELGIHELGTLQDALNIGKRCGGCREDLEQLIELAWA